MSSNKKPVVFIDTNFLLGVSFESDSDWRKLLKHSKDGVVEIYMSKIVYEEWRTHQRDLIFEAVRKAKQALNAFDRGWHKCVITGGREKPKYILNFPELNDLDEMSKQAMDSFISEHLIKIFNCSSAHQDSVVEKYFQWDSPFYDGGNRAEKANREARRKHIPDAWIIEAVLALQSEGYDLLCLCQDDNLSDTLIKSNVQVFKEARQIIELIEPAVAPSVDLPIATHSDDQKNAAIDKILDELALSEKSLKIKLIGYSCWFEPILKEELYEFMLRQGYSSGLIKNLADRLVLAGHLNDTGTHYTSIENELNRMAKDNVREEVEKISGNS